MKVRARLIATQVPAEPAAIAVVLHGGASRRHSMRVSPAQLSVLRMVPVAARLAAQDRQRLAVFRLLNSVRGWDARHTPVDDVAWAMDRIRDRFGAQLPVALVGHSLGGRAALLAASDRQVTSVVAMATWLYPREVVPPLSGRRVLFIHGDRDRVAQLDRVEQAAASLARSTDVGLVLVRGGSHSMLRHHRAFDGTAAEWTAAGVLGKAVDGAAAHVLGGGRLEV